MPLDQGSVGSRREAPKDVQPGETLRGVAVDQHGVKNRFGRGRVMVLLTDPATGEVRELFERAALRDLFAAIQPGDFLEIERLAAAGGSANGWGGSPWRSRGTWREEEDPNDERRERVNYRFMLWQVRKEPAPAWASPELVRAALATAGLPGGTAAPAQPEAPRAPPKGSRKGTPD